MGTPAMNFRSLLLLLLALGTTACPVTVSGALPCNDNTQCPTGSICGEDGHCRANPTCKGAAQICNGVCTDLNTFDNCGGCTTSSAIFKCAQGQVCNTDAAGKGSCSLFCDSQKTNCGGTCRDTHIDAANCGSCGVACAPGQQCTSTGPGGAGQCTIVCQTGLTNCNGTCVDEQRDNHACGGCGAAFVCPSGQACVSSVCSTSCPAGQTNCGGKCIDLSNDRDNCSACGSKCAVGQVCAGSACTLSCPSPLINCGTGTCINPNNDAANCGYCAGVTKPNSTLVGAACATGQSCVVLAGTPACALVCPSGESACPTANPTACANLSTDPANCGACGTGCPSGQSCQSGSCKPTCKTGFTDCGALGCIDTLNDPNHCGPAGSAASCSAAPCAAGQVCSAGTCKATCKAGLTDCGGAVGCVDTLNDPNHCGPVGATASCTAACGSGLVCNNGSCQVACGPTSSGAKNCGGVCVNSNSDNQNCGTCGHACGSGSICNGAGVCAATCGVGANGIALVACSGTCTDTTSDSANCGGCGATFACPSGQRCTPTGQPSPPGKCALSCAAGLLPCPTAIPTGCKDITQDRNNCGACGVACAAGQVCAPNGTGGYACSTSCQSPLVNCNGTCVDPLHDPLNCGYCAGVADPGNATITGKACATGANATAFCSNKVCGLSCSPGFADCNGNPADGCEINTASDPLHCGACAVRCPAPDNSVPTSCVSSACNSGSACVAGFADADGNPANGCESNLANDSQHCGTSLATAVACSGANLFCSGSGSPACTGTPSGVEQNVLISDLVAAGWTQCSLDTYGSTTSISTLQTSCNKGAGQLVVGCRAASGLRLNLAASGAFATVFSTTAASGAGGVQWYFDNGTFGFAPANAAVTRGSNACDSAGTGADGFTAGFGSQRLCWNTSGSGSGNLTPGARCGDAFGLSGTSYERLVFYK